MKRVSQEEKTLRTSTSHRDLPSNLKELNPDETNEKTASKILDIRQ